MHRPPTWPSPVRRLSPRDRCHENALVVCLVSRLILSSVSCLVLPCLALFWPGPALPTNESEKNTRQVFAGGDGGLGGGAGDERLLLGPGLGHQVPPRDPAAGEREETLFMRSGERRRSLHTIHA